MLKTGVFDEFKGATTLLLWGDGEGMGTLFARVSDLRSGELNELPVGEGDTRLTIVLVNGPAEVSALRQEGNGLRWECSRNTVELALDLVEPLLTQTGHQFLDVEGQADQVIIARDEHPADLR